jgi:hypothetical protein
MTEDGMGLAAAVLARLGALTSMKLFAASRADEE